MAFSYCVVHISCSSISSQEVEAKEIITVNELMIIVSGITRIWQFLLFKTPYSLFSILPGKVCQHTFTLSRENGLFFKWKQKDNVPYSKIIPMILQMTKYFDKIIICDRSSEVFLADMFELSRNNIEFMNGSSILLVSESNIHGREIILHVINNKKSKKKQSNFIVKTFESLTNKLMSIRKYRVN